MSIEIAIEKIEKYSKDVFTAIEEAFAVAGSPTKFFTELSKADHPFSRALKYTLGLALCLMAVEMPLMAGVGVDVRSAVYAVSQIFVTIILLFLYALCFHFAIAIAKRDLEYVDTYRVVVYSSI